MLSPEKLLVLGYYASGGWLFSNQISTKLRFLGYLMCAIMMCSVYISTIWTFIKEPKLIIAEKVMVLWCAATFVFFLALIPFITFFYKEDIEELLTFLVDERVSVLRLQQLYSCKNDNVPGNTLNKWLEGVAPTQKASLKNTIHIGLNAVVYTFGIPIGVAFLVNMVYVVIKQSDSYKSISRHIIPIPSADALPSIWVYLLVYSIEVIIVTPGILCAMLHFSFLLTVMSELHNKVVKSCWVIGDFSRAVEIKFAQCLHSRLNSSEKDVFMHQNIMKNNLILISQYYSKIYRKLIICSKLFGYYTSIIIIFYLIGLMFEIIIIANPRTDSDVVIKWAIHSFGILPCLYLMCKTGSMLNQTTDTIVSEVCNIAWECFTPQMRKIYQILLYQVQQPLEIKIINIYPNNMELYPRMLRNLYGLANILRKVL